MHKVQNMLKSHWQSTVLICDVLQEGFWSCSLRVSEITFSHKQHRDSVFTDLVWSVKTRHDLFLSPAGPPSDQEQLDDVWTTERRERGFHFVHKHFISQNKIMIVQKWIRHFNVADSFKHTSPQKTENIMKHVHVSSRYYSFIFILKVHLIILVL